MNRQSNNSGQQMMVEILEERRMMSVASFGTALIHASQANVLRLDESIIIDAKLARSDELTKTLASKQIASPKSQASQSIADKSTSNLNDRSPMADRGVLPTSITGGTKRDHQTGVEEHGAGRANKSPRKPAHHAAPKPAPKPVHKAAAKPAKQPKQRHPHVIQNQAVSYQGAVQGQDPFQQDGFDPASSDQQPLGPTNEPNASGAANWVNESGNPLFGPNGPSPDDIYQGSAADCYFLATLSSVARTDPGLIERDVTSLGGGNYQVIFYYNGTNVDQVVDGYLPVDGNGNLMNAQLGQDNDIWVAIMEKAFANFRSTINGESPDYANINYGVAEEVFNDLGANNIGGLTQSDIPDGQTLYNAAALELANGQAVTFETLNDPNAGPLVSNHLYSVVSVYQNADGSYGLELRNPYGNDGPNGDGYNWIDANTAEGQLYDLASADV